MSDLAQQLIEREKRERTGYLDIGNCGLTELPDLSELEWLETLVVSNSWWNWEKSRWENGTNQGQPNWIVAPPSHPLPFSLKYLVLGGNYGKKWAIGDGAFLGNLTHLTSLSISSNQISSWAFLGNLTNLTSLNISSNQIHDGAFLKKLTSLVSLDLSYNQISDFSFLEKLTNLTTFYLRDNQIYDLSFLEKLTNLTKINLRSNQIRNGASLEKLTNLTWLNLNNNQISDGAFLEKLTNLKALFFSSNQIRNGAFLEKLTNLTWLNLSHNQITDSTFLEKLTNLKALSLRDNPIQNPPPAVIEKGLPAIREYFEQKRKTKARPLLEAKLVLLGDGRAGKTSLANRLLRKPLPTEADRTQGVDIVIGEYNFTVPEGEFNLHIWDFAGQDKYKPLHQFFYTEGAVYVLVADSGNAGTDFNDWLQTAELFGEGSPLVITLNEFREGIGRGTFDEERWRKQFPNLLREVHLVNLLSEKGFPELERCLRYLAEQLPHAKVEYPNNWAAIRTELERRRNENYISLQEYYRVCSDNDLPAKESALILSGILHKIGVCLHYQKSDLLCQHVILKNEWATGAVYKILENPQVAEDKKGFFDWDDLRRIWAEGDYAEMRPQLLELMQQFKMAYPLPNQREFVTPPLLPAAPPANWDLPAAPATLEMFVEYKFLPKALLTQFIVSRHADIDRGRTLVWRNGVVLRWSADTVAEVKAFKSRGRDAFYIRAQGGDRRGLLTAILKTLRDLHADYSGIEAYEIVPCPCSACRTKQNESEKHFFDFANLQNRLERGRRTVECDKSLMEVDLVKLLGDLFVFENLSIGRRVVLKEVKSPAPVALPAAPMAFFSYSKEDLAYLKEFQTHLHPLKRAGKIQFWDDREIRPGEDWDDSIREALATADIVFLLLSPDFLATDYIAETEIAEAMRRHESGAARVIPIKVRPCSWAGTPFQKLQGVPRKDMVVSTAPDRDSVWLEVLREVERELDGFETAQ